MFRCEDYPCCGHDHTGPRACLPELVASLPDAEAETWILGVDLEDLEITP